MSLVSLKFDREGLAPIDEPRCCGARGSSAARASRLSDLSGLTVAGDVGEEMDVAPTVIARSLGIESYLINS